MQILNHRIYGTGNPVIYILHGIFGMLDNWHYVAGILGQNCTVVTSDARNHGKSFHTENMSFDNMAEDIQHLMAHLGHEKIILAGHSMGGKTAMKFAQNFPTLLDKLAIIDIANKTYAPSHLAYFQAFKDIDFSTIRSRAEADLALIPYASDLAVRQFLLKNLEPKPAGGYKPKFNIEAIQRNYNAIIGAIDLPIPTWKGPTLFISGEKSKYIKESDKVSLTSEFPKSTFAKVSSAGHWVHADNPAEFLDIFQTFIQS